MKRFIASGVQAERLLENVQTGLDLSVPKFNIENVNSNLFVTPVITFTLVVVTDNPVIVELVKNKTTGESFAEGTIIHFTQNKTYDEIWDLRKHLDRKYSGTFVPELPKKMGRGGSIVSSKSALRTETRNRQTSADNFLRWCSSTTKIAESEILLKFIGWRRKAADISQKSVTNIDTDYLTAETAKAIFQTNSLQENEIETTLFDQNTNDGVDEDLFAAATLCETSNTDEIPASRQKQDQLENNLDFFNEENSNAAKTVRLFDAFSENESWSDLKSNVEERVIDEQNSPSGSHELIEDISDINLKMKEFNRQKTQSKATSRIKNTLKVTEPTTVDAEQLAEDDLLQYIAEQEIESEDLDLGL